VIAPNESDTFEHLWDGWTDYCEDSREYVGTKKAFGQKVKDKEFKTTRPGAAKVLTYIGIRCIRENRKKQAEEARRKTEEMNQQTEEARRQRMREKWRPPPDDEDPPY